MEQDTTSCDHRWRYFVHLQSRSVRVRECERCGRRSVLSARLASTPAMRKAEPRAATPA